MDDTIVQISLPQTSFCSPTELKGPVIAIITTVIGFQTPIVTPPEQL